MFRFVFTVLAVLSFLSASLSAQTRSVSGAHQNSGATIQGTTLDPRGNPVVHASVTLSTPTEVQKVIQTDDQGDFSFADLAAGTYRVAASAPGLAAAADDIELRANETHRADLSLALTAVDQHVVVSASLGDVLATETASSVSVIDEDQIAARDAQTVADVLREVPGVVVSDAGRLGGETGVFIRGGNSDYNLVMVDGIPLNEFGGSFDFSPLLTDGVAQVEVVRGAESALYGSNAVTSVVNVVTHQGGGPPSFSALMEGGSYDTYRVATGGAGSFHGFDWSYDLSRLGTNGVVTNDDYHNQTSFISLGYSGNPRRRLDFHFFGDASNAGDPGAYGSDPNDDFPGIDTVSRLKENLFGYQASDAEQITSRWKQTTTVSVAINRFVLASTPGNNFFDKNRRVVANTRAEIALAPNDSFVAGFEYNREDYEDTFVTDANNSPFLLPRTSLAYFAENRWSPGRRWTLTAGVRVDDIRTDALPANFFGNPPLPASSVVQVNPRGSVAYLLRQGGLQSIWGATRLHASGGTGIRPPSGEDLAFSNNPDLKPERSITTDVGIEQRLFRDRAVAGVTYFYNRFEDQIVTLPSPQDPNLFISQNLKNSSAQGIEFSLRIQPMRNLQVSTTYTWMQTQVLALDGSIMAAAPYQVGQPLLRQPRNAGSYDVTWNRGRLRLNTNGYVRGQVLDVDPTFGAGAGFFENHGYFVMNGGFSVRTFRGMEVYGQLNNFTDQKYEEAFGFPAYRLNFTSGIRLRFPGERGAISRP